MIDYRYFIFLSILFIVFNCTDEERKTFEKKVLNNYSDIPKVDGILSEKDALRVASKDNTNIKYLEKYFNDLRNLKPGILVLVEDHYSKEFYYFASVHLKETDTIAVYSYINAYTGERIEGGGGLYLYKDVIDKNDLEIYISENEAKQFYKNCKYKKISGDIVNIKAVLIFQDNRIPQRRGWFWCIETENSDVYLLNPYLRLNSIKDRKIRSGKVWYHAYRHRLFKVEDEKQKKALINFEFDNDDAKYRYGVITIDRNKHQKKHIIPTRIRLEDLTPLDDF